MDKGITTGYGDNLFGPDDSVTRAQAVTFLYRLAGAPDVSVADRFDDVEYGDWFDRAVSWAVSYGITNGISDTRFAPYEPVTYAQMLTFLARAGGVTVTGANWAQDAIDWARGAGATGGLGFTGGDACPRRDVVYIMYNVSA